MVENRDKVLTTGSNSARMSVSWSARIRERFFETLYLLLIFLSWRDSMHQCFRAVVILERNCPAIHPCSASSVLFSSDTDSFIVSVSADK